MFDIYYLGSNEKLKEDLPVAKQVDSLEDINPRTKMFWLVEPSIEVTDYGIFEFRPNDYDHKYEHVFKWDRGNYGGLRLIPSKNPEEETKQVNRVVCKRTFEVLRKKTPGKYFEQHPHASHVWCVDPEYVLTDDIDWAPGNFEPNFIHSFHLKGQLEHLYPESEGGVKLFPRDHKKAHMKYHGFLNNVVDYPVLYVEDVDNYSQRDTFNDEYVWLIDKEYRVNPDDVDWVPNPFERDMVHSFRMPYQLNEKYPMAMGGIRLVPKQWKNAPVKIHKDCPIEDENYDVFYTNRKFDADTFDHYAERAGTDWFWVVDRTYDFNGKLLYVPAEHEQEYIHVFKWGLEDRYDPEVTELWDERVGGIYLVNKNFDITQQKLHTDIVPVRYDIFYVPHEDLTNYEKYARKSHTDAFWLVDEEYQLVDNFIKYVPAIYDQRYINIFKVPGQLSHKYPLEIKNVSDNRCGGAKLVPKQYDPSSAKYQGNLGSSDIEFVRYEIFSTESEGRARTKHDWFWVVDPDVVVLDTFDFDWLPDINDSGKNHTWQKLNPVTNKQYDYGGVMLCPKNKTSKGRPKFVMAPASTQREYPVFHLKTNRSLISQLEEFDDKTQTKMYWVLDPGVEPAEDFNFDYYPTQYDIDKVHVFQNEKQEYRDVRLIPKDTFEPGIHMYSEEDYRYNSFQYLKEMPTVASKLPTYPVVEFEKFNVAELGKILASHKNNSVPYVWTVDPDVKAITKVFKQTLNQEQTTDFSGKVVAYQRVNDKGEVLSNSGVRLWSTEFNVGVITTDQLRLNDVKNCEYMDEPGCTQKTIPVWNLDMSTDIITQLENIAGECKAEMFWAVDPFTVLEPGFEFDYYPTRWDINTVHVFRTNAGTYRNVRLYPTHLFHGEHGFTADDVSYNSFPDIKLIDQVASVQESWLVHKFTKWEDVTVEKMRSLLNSYKEQGHKYIWSVDPDVQAKSTVMGELYSPDGNPQLFNMPIDPTKVHVWQCVDKEDSIINYAGLRLWPTNFDLDEVTTEQLVTSDCESQRYIEEPGSVLNTYPVYQITDSEAMVTQLNDFDVKTEAGMYWVIDPGVEIDEEELHYLPNQWDKSTVHVFETTNQNRYVRLYPKETYPNDMSVEDIANNSFTPLKVLDTINVKPSLWPVERFTDVTVGELKEILEKHKNSEYVWVIDPDVEEKRALIYSSYSPKLDNHDRVHVWQRVNEEDGKVAGYGGLRLFPTSFKPTKQFTDEMLRTSEIENQLLLEEVGSTQRIFEMCVIDPAHDYIKQAEEFDKKCTSSMYWLIDPFVKRFPGWNYKFSPNKWEEKTVHVFRTAQDEYRNVRLVPKGTFAGKHGLGIKEVTNNSFANLKQVDIVASTTTAFPIIDMATVTDRDEFVKQINEHKEQGHSFAWTTDTDVDVYTEVIDDSFMPQLNNIDKVHVWQRLNPHTEKTHSYGGLRLWPTNKDYASLTTDQIFLNKIRGLQYVREPGSTYKSYDIVFLSYHETYAENAYKRLQARFPNALWVRDIDGIFSAHQEAAKQVGTSMFWVVDADSMVDDEFDFSYIPDVYDQEVVHVWLARNPITGTEYGYGGIKLFNTKQVLDATSWGLDFTTGLSSRFKAMPEVASTTKFNTDEFATWRGAFRECVKLTVNADGESIQRLSQWMNPAKDAEFKEAARAGAQAGTVYAKENINKPVRLAKINDYEWLENRYKEDNE